MSHRRASFHATGAALLAFAALAHGVVTAGGTSSSIHTTADDEALRELRDAARPVFDAARTLNALPRPGGLDPGAVDAILDVLDEGGVAVEDAIAKLGAATDASSLSVQQPGVALPKSASAAKFVGDLKSKLTGARDALARAVEFGASRTTSGMTPRERARFERDVARAAACLLVARGLLLGDPVGDVDAINTILATDIETLLDPCAARNRRGMPPSSRARDALRAKVKKRRAAADDDDKAERRAPAGDEYTAVVSTGKDPGGFYFATFLFELTGDVDASVELGRFSDKPKVAAASGDGEFQCIEVATVGSEPGAAFASACARYIVSGPSAGFQGFISTPGGTTGNIFLPGVTRAELRIELRSGTLTAFLREADSGAAFQQFGSVTAPAGPLTFSLGAAGLGAGDEVGFDELVLSALQDP